MISASWGRSTIRRATTLECPQRFADLLKHWYPSGGPGLLLIWNRFVVFRVEAGFSREGGALYLQSEHAF